MEEHFKHLSQTFAMSVLMYKTLNDINLKNFYVVGIFDLCRIIGFLTINARVAQLDRAFGYEPKGREFESCHARHFNREP